MKRFADIIIRFRTLVLMCIAAATIVSLYGMSRLTVETYFNDLLPQQHPFIKVHNKIRNIFGGANQVIIMVQVRQGDIFNRETLEKVKWITREVEEIPGVDPYKIRSIAVSKMKDFKFSSGTMEITPLMFPDVPQTEKEMQELRDKIYSNSRYYGNFVSYDSKKTRIMVDFFEQNVDYNAIFSRLQRIRRNTEDENHIISIAGEPMHIGYIYYHTRHVLLLICGTVLAIMGMLFLYYRSVRAVLIPILTAVVSAVWGLGFMGFMGFNLDPLILVLPFLMSLMTLPHSMQCISRFLEEYNALRDIERASERTVETMFLPGLTGVVTDALGIALVAISGIPLLMHMSIVSVFWCVVTIVILSLIMTPLLLSYTPETRRLKNRFDNSYSRMKTDYRSRFLGACGRWIPGRGKWYISAAVVVIVCIGLNYALQIRIGDFMPGSSILWPFHRYNKDAFRITFSIPLLNPLYVVAAAGEGEGGWVSRGETLRELNRFQRYLNKHERILFTASIVNPLPGFLMTSYEDDPQWCHLSRRDRVLSFCARKLLYTGEPGTWDRFVDMQEKYANIIIYCRDKMPATIESVMDHITGYLEETPGPPGGRYLLAGGAVGVQAAVRDMIADSQIWNLMLALGGIALFCMMYFRSVAAGLILVIPLAISNVITFALMGAYHIGLTVNTYPVSSIGIGLGVDYGIYLMSRLREESAKGVSIQDAISTALQTSGKTIVMIATTLTIGLILWIFSALKFQAEMGVLLAVLLLLNMVGAIFLVPTLLCIFKPKFLRPAPEAAQSGAESGTQSSQRN